MQITMILEFPASYCHLARGPDRASLLAVFFSPMRVCALFNVLPYWLKTVRSMPSD